MIGLLKGLFSKGEELVGLDIGSTGVRLVELDVTRTPPELVAIGEEPLTGEVFSGQLIANPETVAEKISTLIELEEAEGRRLVIAMPGPGVFTKKIKMGKLPPAELADAVVFEASSFIPHDLDAIKLDYHVIGEADQSQLDVLVVASKSETIESYTDCASLAGLEVGIVDVDYFALQNCFEMGYPELADKTVALIHMGARYSAINICHQGQSLFTGDIGVGGKLFTDAICQELGVTADIGEQYKQGNEVPSSDVEVIKQVLEQKIEYVASEFNRQLTLFWNASGAEEGIETLLLTGGGSLVEGLSEALGEKTGMRVERLDPYKGLQVDEQFDRDELDRLSPHVAVCVGLAVRQLGDKEIPEFEESEEE